MMSAFLVSGEAHDADGKHRSSASESRFALVSASDLNGGPRVGLEADDFVIEDDGTVCDVIDVAPTSYPIAVIIDTSSFARSDFQQVRDAVHQFVGALSGRDVALYETGGAALRAVGFTRDRGQLEAGVSHLFARPNAAPRNLDGIIEAAAGLRQLMAPVTRMVVVSAGGPDAGARAPRDVLEAVMASRSIVDVVNRLQTRGGRLSGRAARSTTSSMSADADATLLHALSERTLGLYEDILAASGYSLFLKRLRNQLQSEVIVEYSAPNGAARKLRVGVRLPGVVVRGVAIERPRQP